MASLRIAAAPEGAQIRGVVAVPGDKSVSHRAAILGALAGGITMIRNCAPGDDVRSTLSCLTALGAGVQRSNSTVMIEGVGQPGLTEPADVLDCGNSGTTMRLLAGVLAGQPFMSVLSGDGSLRRRPMRRVLEPLARMGARTSGREHGCLAPLVIQGGALCGLGTYRPTVTSAQVKSCLLLAGLAAYGETKIIEPVPTRDHTERMLTQFGVVVSFEPGRISLRGPQSLRAAVVDVPGDISSAAYWMVLGAAAPNADITVSGVGLNPGRTGLLAVLERMGCNLHITPGRTGDGEPVGDVRVTTSNLRGVEVTAAEVPALLDELPALAVAAAMAQGRTVVRGAGELRHKESNRLAAIVQNLQAMGVRAAETADGLAIEGIGLRGLRGAAIQTHGDHRIAMAFGIAALLAQGETVLDDGGCIAVSYPGFADQLRRLQCSADLVAAGE